MSPFCLLIDLDVRCLEAQTECACLHSGKFVSLYKHVFILKIEQQEEREREAEKERSSFFRFTPKCPQEPGLVYIETRSQELFVSGGGLRT